MLLKYSFLFSEKAYANLTPGREFGRKVHKSSQSVVRKKEAPLSGTLL